MRLESIIGGADGPTALFLATQLGLRWLNVFGIITIILLLIPNIVYAIRCKKKEKDPPARFMDVLEQIGRYGCMFLMVFNAGLTEFGFPSLAAFLICMAGDLLLLIAYWIIWILYFKKQTHPGQMALAVIPVCLFLLNGITMRHYLLIIFAVIFGIAHIYVTGRKRVDADR